MIHVFFLIRSLEYGGAERQLVELIRGLDKKRFIVTVATFYDGGGLRAEIEGIENTAILSLHKTTRWDLLPFLLRFWRTVKELKPDVLHGYMGIANELCLLAGKALHRKVVWGIRASNVDFSRYDWLARWSFRVGAWLSRFPDCIIVNSWAGREHHISHGYQAHHMIVIANGIDTNRFKPDGEAGLKVRREWGIRDDEDLIGLVARLDAMKDHPTFLDAAAKLSKETRNVRFVCIGSGPEGYRYELETMSQRLGLENCLIWAGTRSDMPAVYNALDIATCCSSYGEGFPNVIGEAMACEVLCVVTDVGDSAEVLAEAGVAVRPREPEALSEGWKKILDMPTDEKWSLKKKARERIVENFSRSIMISRTEEALTQLISDVNLCK